MLKKLKSVLKTGSSVKPDVYIHIGMPKTGTTSIQNNLFHNRSVLEWHGIHYPMAGLDKTGHHLFAASIENESFKSEHYGEVCFNDETRARIQAEIVKDIEQGHASRVVVSSEVLWKIRDYSLLKRVFQDFRPKIVVYLRRQDQAILSTYSMLVKWGAAKENFNHYLAKSRDDYLYSTKLDDLALAFGKDNVIVRVFDEKRLKNSSLLEDFFEVIGSQHVLPVMAVSEQRDNEALSLLKLEFKRRLNKSGLNWNKGRDILRQLENIDLGEKDSSIKSLLKLEERRELMSYYQDDNEYIHKKYLASSEYETLFSAVNEDITPPKQQLDLDISFEIFSKIFETN